MKNLELSNRMPKYKEGDCELMFCLVFLQQNAWSMKTMRPISFYLDKLYSQ